MKQEHVLDPLWITKGQGGLDPEYHKYILLAANKKYRKKLDEGDISSFYEIVFHALNLNNLAVDGSVFKFNMTPVWDNPKLKSIRKSLRKLYQLPEDLVDILKNANFLLTNLIVDYLDEILESSDKCKVFFVNQNIHTQRETFIVINQNKSTSYSIWKLRFDRRFKFGHNLEKVREVELDINKDNALRDAVDKLKDPQLKNMDANTNVCFAITDDNENELNIASFVSNSIIFSNGILKRQAFNPRVLDDLFELVKVERVIPFTMKAIG